MRYRVGFDIGGTFTDFVLFDPVTPFLHCHDGAIVQTLLNTRQHILQHRVHLLDARRGWSERNHRRNRSAGQHNDRGEVQILCQNVAPFGNRRCDNSLVGRRRWEQFIDPRDMVAETGETLPS